MWIPHLVLLKSVLIFHHWDFYGTDSIPEKYGGRNLIFQEIVHRRMDGVYLPQSWDEDGLWPHCGVEKMLQIGGNLDIF